MRRLLPWLALVVVVGVALGVGATSSGRRSDEDRMQDIAASIRCPTCRSQSVLDSDAPTADNIRKDIRRRIAAGESDGEIRAYYVSRYGQSILLTPPRSGIAALVWVLPVAALVLAVAGLGFAFRRWRAEPGVAVTDEDRVRVERERHRRPPPREARA